MRNELNLWVAGGDMRQAKLAELLAADGHTVHAYALERLGALDGVEMEESSVQPPDVREEWDGSTVWRANMAAVYRVPRMLH